MVSCRDHLTGVDADPHREAEAATALEIGVQPLEAPPHSERGADRPRRVVLVRDRHAECAITASPMNFSTVPPSASISSRMASGYA